VRKAEASGQASFTFPEAIEPFSKVRNSWRHARDGVGKRAERQHGHQGESNWESRKTEEQKAAGAAVKSLGRKSAGWLQIMSRAFTERVKPRGNQLNFHFAVFC